jgi:hypothetical protein
MGKLYAIDVSITAPIFTGAGDGTGTGPAPSAALNADVIRVFQELERSINNQIGNIHTNPQNLIGAFANSSVFSSDGATQRAYGGYNAFALTLGSMFGYQLASGPGSPFSIVSEMDNLLGTLETDGDTELGINPQILNAQLGINTSGFLLRNFYLGLKFGFMRLPVENYDISTLSAGVMGNYQLFSRIRFPTGVFLWRGLNLGAGLIYQNSNLSMDFPLEAESRSVFVYGSNVTMQMQPKLGFNFNINTFTIPLEVMTSFRLFHLMNLAFGLGADIGFGNASLASDGAIDLRFENLPEDLSYTPASMGVDMGGKASPSLINPKIMSGIGFSLGPVIIYIPFTYYPLDNGFNLGFTLGIIW